MLEALDDNGIRAALDRDWEHRPELRRLIAEPPSAYLRCLWFDTCVFRPDLIENIVALAGADRVLLGSDYPFDMGDQDPVKRVEECRRLDDAQRAAAVGGNARALFRLGLHDLAGADPAREP